MANHCTRYFQYLQIPYLKWTRSQISQSKKCTLQEKIQKCSHILLLINDDAIEPFFQENKNFFKNKILLHFSGHLVLDQIIDLHPLMTFGLKPYDKKTYQSTGFVTSYADFNKDIHLPGVPNHVYEILPEKKHLYHASCVLAGNFTHLLWTKLKNNFAELNLPEELYLPYLIQTLENLTQKETANTLTGPLARKDKQTIKNNLKALKNDPYQKVYQAFVDAHLGSDFLHTPLLQETQL